MNLRLASAALHSGSTVGQLTRLGSVPHPQLARWQTSDSHRLLRTSVRPLADSPACAGVTSPGKAEADLPAHSGLLILQLGWLNTLRFAPDGVAASGLRLLLPQLPAFTGCCPLSRQTGGEPPTRIGCSSLRLHRSRFARLAPCVSTPGWAFCCTPSFSRTLHRRQADDEYSLATGSRTFRICLFYNLRLASAFASLGAASDPSRAFAPGFTLWLGRRRSSGSHRLFVPSTVPAINPDALLAHQLK
jgi:hypothetical protein